MSQFNTVVPSRSRSPSNSKGFHRYLRRGVNFISFLASNSQADSIGRHQGQGKSSYIGLPYHLGIHSIGHQLRGITIIIAGHQGKVIFPILCHLTTWASSIRHQASSLGINIAGHQGKVHGEEGKVILLISGYLPLLIW